MAITAQLLHEYRTYLHRHATQAKQAITEAKTKDQAEYNRGRRIAYTDALAQFDELIADVVVVALVPSEEGRQ